MDSDEHLIQKLSENTRAVVPTTTQYIMATGKQALALLQSAASVIPVPLLQEAIGVAMKIIEVCEVCGILHEKATRRFTYVCVYQEASAVQQKVKELQERVGHLMIVIVDNVTVKYEEGSEVVVKAVGVLRKISRPPQVCLVYFDNRQLLSMLQHSEDDRQGVDRNSQTE
jgi:hypothetical protein